MSEIRRLGILAGTLQGLGYEITNAYEDLLFIEHLPFLLQFDAKDADKLFFYLHKEMETAEGNEILMNVSDALKKDSFSIIKKGTFACVPNAKNKEAIDIVFYD